MIYNNKGIELISPSNTETDSKILMALQKMQSDSYISVNQIDTFFTSSLVKHIEVLICS